MFAKLTTKIALRKAGISSSALSFPEYESKSGLASKDGKSANGKDGKGANGEELLPFANPFANLSMPKSWQSWATPSPPPVEVKECPVVGGRVPIVSGSGSAKLGMMGRDGRACAVVFLRCCGCVFAEKTFLEMRRLANKYPNIHFIAVSHNSKEATDKWIAAVGGKWAVEVVVDEEREVYATWGLGISNTYHLLNPWTQMAARKLGTGEGIWGREVDPSGNRWQIGGAWAMDERGIVRWGGAAKTADEIPDLVEACKSLGVY